MKIVIPYRDFHGLELKYALRGIEKFIDQPEVTIIGDLPKWIKNVTHIPFKDNPMNGHRSKNIFDKIMLVDYDFLFFNDDHFLLEPFSPETFHYSGTLTSELNRPNLSSCYRKTIENTLKVFGPFMKNFDTHCPIFYQPRILNQLKIFKNIDWTKPQGYCIKSVYCFIAGIEGTEYPDLKIRTQLQEQQIKQLIEGRPYFSTGNYSFNRAVINVLEEIFPNKSIYE